MPNYDTTPFTAKNLFKDVAANVIDVQAIRNSLEGPKPLRATSAMVGFALFLFSGLGMFNIFLIASPSLYILQAYEAFFGLAIMIIELKDQTFARKYKNFIYKWFPFTTVMAGKGLLLMTAGMLGVGFGFANFLLAIPGLCAFFIGIVYICMHLGKAQRMNEMYDVSMYQFNNSHA